MGAIAQSVEDDLATLSRIIARLERRVGAGPSRSTDDPVVLAQTIFLQRRQRAVLFQEISDILVEPAWDILLSLYTAADPRGLPASTAGTVSGVPHTTALRYLGTLESRGLVESDTIDQDRRCRFVRLSQSARDRLTSHLTEAPLAVAEKAFEH